MEKLKSTESREKYLPWEWCQAQPSRLLWQPLRSRNRQRGGGEGSSFFPFFLPLSPSLRPSLPFCFLSSLSSFLSRQRSVLLKGLNDLGLQMTWVPWQARKDSIFVGTGYCGKFKCKEKSGSKARPSGSLFGWVNFLLGCANNWQNLSCKDDGSLSEITLWSTSENKERGTGGSSRIDLGPNAPL